MPSAITFLFSFLPLAFIFYTFAAACLKLTFAIKIPKLKNLKIIRSTKFNRNKNSIF